MSQDMKKEDVPTAIDLMVRITELEKLVERMQKELTDLKALSNGFKRSLNGAIDGDGKIRSVYFL